MPCVFEADFQIQPLSQWPSDVTQESCLPSYRPDLTSSLLQESTLDLATLLDTTEGQRGPQVRQAAPKGWRFSRGEGAAIDIHTVSIKVPK